jgi:DNA-binding IclR family transcriptional regulator
MPQVNKAVSDEGAAGPPNSGIRTIHVAATILNALADYDEPVRVTDLARRLKMTMATISRHLSTWRSLGFVDKPEGQESYRLNMSVVRLANAAIQQNDFAGVARPYLVELRDTIAETIVLCSKERDGMFALVCLDSGRSTTVVVREGTRVDLPYSPAARLIWGFSDPELESLDAIADSFDYSMDPRWSANTFKRKIRRAREEWYDYEIDLAGSHIGAVAAPVFDHRNLVVGAVSIIRPSGSLQPDPSDELISATKRCAAAISEALGSKAWEGHRD